MAEVLTPSDPDFAAKIRGGDRTAIQTAVEAYLSQILRAARGAGLAPQEAEDVTQATFATFIESAPRFEGRSSVRTWLFGILYKKIAEARRAGQRDRQNEEIDEGFERRGVGTDGNLPRRRTGPRAGRLARRAAVATRCVSSSFVDVPPLPPLRHTDPSHWSRCSEPIPKPP